MYMQRKCMYHGGCNCHCLVCACIDVCMHVCVGAFANQIAEYRIEYSAKHCNVYIITGKQWARLLDIS